MDLLKSRAAQELGGGHGELKKNKTNSGTEPERVIELMIIIIIILIAVTNIIKWKRTSQLQNR